jgi:hypothetical protein
MTKIAGSGSRTRIRIHWSEVWIRGSGSGSTPKCHGSATLVFCKLKKCVADVLCIHALCGPWVSTGTVPNRHVDSCRGSCFMRSVQGVSKHGSHKSGSTAAIPLPIGYRRLNLAYPNIKSAHTHGPHYAPHNAWVSHPPA